MEIGTTRARATLAASQYCKPFDHTSLVYLSAGSLIGGYNLFKSPMVAPAGTLVVFTFFGLSAYLEDRYFKCVRKKENELLSDK